MSSKNLKFSNRLYCLIPRRSLIPGPFSSRGGEGEEKHENSHIVYLQFQQKNVSSLVPTHSLRRLGNEVDANVLFP